MSDETTLLPCPFCSAKPELWSDSRRTWGLVQHNDGCLFPSFPKHEIPKSDFAAWNTRAELGSTCPFARPTDLTDGCAVLERIAELGAELGKVVD